MKKFNVKEVIINSNQKLFAIAIDNQDVALPNVLDILEIIPSLTLDNLELLCKNNDGNILFECCYPVSSEKEGFFISKKEFIQLNKDDYVWNYDEDAAFYAFNSFTSLKGAKHVAKTLNKLYRKNIVKNMIKWNRWIKPKYRVNSIIK